MAAVSMAAAENRLTPEEKAAGWRLLFDGSTYAGWEEQSRKSPPGDSFTIEDGCLKAVPHPRITEDLFTTDVFADFELVFDWKISLGGNSGVKFRIQDRVFLPDGKGKFEDRVNAALRGPKPARAAKGQEYVIGFEYQLTDNARNSDAARNGPTHQAGALYDIAAPLKDATKPVGEFNQSRLVARRDQVELWLNGEKVVTANLKSAAVSASMAKRWGQGAPVSDLLVKQPRTRCQISLQNHGDAAWFKNIKIRPLQ